MTPTPAVDGDTPMLAPQVKGLEVRRRGCSMLALIAGACSIAIRIFSAAGDRRTVGPWPDSAAWRGRCCSWPDDVDPFDPSQPWPPKEAGDGEL
jgi:hypothetical protein